MNDPNDPFDRAIAENHQIRTELHRLRAINAELVAALKWSIDQFNAAGLSEYTTHLRAALTKAEQVRS